MKTMDAIVEGFDLTPRPVQFCPASSNFCFSPVRSPTAAPRFFAAAAITRASASQPPLLEGRNAVRPALEEHASPPPATAPLQAGQAPVPFPIHDRVSWLPNDNFQF